MVGTMDSAILTRDVHLSDANGPNITLAVLQLFLKSVDGHVSEIRLHMQMVRLSSKNYQTNTIVELIQLYQILPFQLLMPVHFLLQTTLLMQCH